MSIFSPCPRAQRHAKDTQTYLIEVEAASIVFCKTPETEMNHSTIEDYGVEKQSYGRIRITTLSPRTTSTLQVRKANTILSSAETLESSQTHNVLVDAKPQKILLQEAGLNNEHVQIFSQPALATEHD